MSTSTAVSAPASGVARWGQLGLGLLCMIAISSPQYVWTLFTKPFGTQLAAPAAAIQVTFSILIVLQTFFSPIQGELVQRFGPRRLIAIGGLLSGLSWVLASQVESLWGLYLTYGLIGGIGTGIVYVGVVGQMVGGFPDRRGFAAGVVAAGYGMGAIATTFPIADSLAAHGHQATLLRFGVIFGAVGLLAALGLRPTAASSASSAPLTGSSTRDMLRSPIFWLMFLMMSLMSTSGLMATSQIGAIAADAGVTKATVWGFAALPLALTIDRFCNGLTRPFFGWLSDRLGREQTMCLAFALEGAAMTLWLLTRTDPVLFVFCCRVSFSSAGARPFRCFPRR